MLSLLPLLVHGLRAPLPQRVASRSAVPMMQDALEQASASADAFYSMLGDLQPPPSSLASLKDAIASGDLKKVRVAQYNLLIDQTLLCEAWPGTRRRHTSTHDATLSHAGTDDVEGEGEGATLVPTAAKMEQDDPLTKEKMRYAYRRRDPALPSRLHHQPRSSPRHTATASRCSWPT